MACWAGQVLTKREFAYLLWPLPICLGEPPRWPLTSQKPDEFADGSACFFTIAPTTPAPAPDDISQAGI